MTLRTSSLLGSILLVVACSDGTFSESSSDGEWPDDADSMQDGGSGGTSASASGGAGGSGGSTGGDTPSSGGSGGSDPGSGNTSGGSDAATGGSPGSGGSVPGSGGVGPGSGGSVPGSGGTSTSGDHRETHTEPGATGEEADGMIPVCCVPSADEQVQIDAVFELLNAYRVSQGLSALSTDLNLQAAIEGHCHHMAVHSFFSHDAPEPVISRFTARAEACGARANGENIASGYRTAEDVMTGWKNSPGHDENMRGARWTRVGIGYYEREWGQVFGQ